MGRRVQSLQDSQQHSQAPSFEVQLECALHCETFLSSTRPSHLPGQQEHGSQSSLMLLSLIHIQSSSKSSWPSLQIHPLLPTPLATSALSHLHPRSWQQHPHHPIVLGASEPPESSFQDVKHPLPLCSISCSGPSFHSKLLRWILRLHPGASSPALGHGPWQSGEDRGLSLRGMLTCVKTTQHYK